MARKFLNHLTLRTLHVQLTCDFVVLDNRPIRMINTRYRIICHCCTLPSCLQLIRKLKRNIVRAHIIIKYDPTWMFLKFGQKILRNARLNPFEIKFQSKFHDSWEICCFEWVSDSTSVTSVSCYSANETTIMNIEF